MRGCESPTRVGDGLPSEGLHHPLAFQRPLLLELCRLMVKVSCRAVSLEWIIPLNALVPDGPWKIHRSLPWAPPLKCILLLEPPPPLISTSSLGPQKNAFLQSFLFPSHPWVVSVFWPVSR